MVFSKNNHQYIFSLLAGTTFENSHQQQEKLNLEHNLVVEEFLSKLNKENTQIIEQQLINVGNIEHLSTTLSIENSSRDTLEMLATVYPNSTILGLPTKPSIKFIEKNENFERGLYSSAIGWFNTHEEALFALGIRAGYFNEKSIALIAGAGIVKDSIAQEEWEETEQKLFSLEKNIAECFGSTIRPG